MSENKGYSHPEALVDAEWVQAHLADPTVRLIEVDVDTTAYEQGTSQAPSASTGKRNYRTRSCVHR